MHTAHHTAEEHLFRPMAASMKVDFLFNEQGDVWLLHSAPLPDILKWVEYDGDTHQITLATASGMIQDLGLRITPQAGQHLMMATEITVLLMREGKIDDFAIVPLVARMTDMM